MSFNLSEMLAQASAAEEPADYTIGDPIKETPPPPKQEEEKPRKKVVDPFAAPEAPLEVNTPEQEPVSPPQPEPVAPPQPEPVAPPERKPAGASILNNVPKLGESAKPSQPPTSPKLPVEQSPQQSHSSYQSSRTTTTPRRNTAKTAVSDISVDNIKAIVKLSDLVRELRYSDMVWTMITHKPSKSMEEGEFIHAILNSTEMDKIIIQRVIEAKDTDQFERPFYVMGLERNELSGVGEFLKPLDDRIPDRALSHLDYSRIITSVIADLDTPLMEAMEEALEMLNVKPN